MNMFLARVIVSIAVVLIVSLLALCVVAAIRTTKNASSNEGSTENKSAKKRPIADIENLDLGAMFPTEN